MIMEDFYDKSIMHYTPKQGDIKVDSAELQALLAILEGFCDVVIRNSPAEEIEKIGQKIKYIEYFNNKYIVLSELREKQKFWFNILKKVQEGGRQNASDEVFEKLKRDVLAEYLEQKTQRENLQREVNKLSTLFDNENNI